MAAANTSTAREYHAGLAAMLGVRAALAARRGYRAEESILETKRGFLEVYGGIESPSAVANVTRDLGQSWDIITDMAVKLVPGGHPYHALAEAAANAAKEGNIAPQDIESITMSRPGFTALTGPLHPTDLIGMAHSPAYFLAAGAADHDFSWVHATAAKIADPVIHRLIDKVRVGPVPTGDTERYRQGATVTIRTTDGRVSTSTVFAPKGSGAGGLAWADIDRKYHLDASRRLARKPDRGELGGDPRFPPRRARLRADELAAHLSCFGGNHGYRPDDDLRELRLG
jgi:2-methylcitrate dehydratase PrpD